MSKIYDKYLELKKMDATKLYLFHSGKFYIFLDQDADYINEFVVLKKTKFTSEVDKCGFPDNVLDNYLKVFRNHKLNIEVIDKIEKKSSIEDFIRNLDIDQLTPKEALLKLYELRSFIDE